MNILYCGYRTWALDALRMVREKNIPNVSIASAQKPHDMHKILKTEKFDVIFMAGWSWIIEDDICKNYTVVGVHPSDLPAYAGGTPLQHQILDGITQSKATLFLVPPGVQLDRGPILLKEPLNLEGNMTDIFCNLTRVTARLLERFITQHPITPVEQPLDVPPTKKRLKPADGELSADDFKNKSVRQLYDFIRCREDPYPNTFISDDTGTLYFNRVKFTPKP